MHCPDNVGEYTDKPGVNKTGSVTCDISDTSTTLVQGMD